MVETTSLSLSPREREAMEKALAEKEAAARLRARCLAFGIRVAIDEAYKTMNQTYSERS